MKKLCILVVPLFLAGCGLPPAFAIASYAIDGILLLTKGKTSTDLAISVVAQQDCAMWRIVQGREICTDYEIVAPGEDGIALAEASTTDEAATDIDSDETAFGSVDVAALEVGTGEQSTTAVRNSVSPFGTPTFRKKTSRRAVRKDIPSRSFSQPSPTYRKAKTVIPTTAEALPTKIAPTVITPVDNSPLVGEIPVKVSALSDIPVVSETSDDKIVLTSVQPDIEASQQMAALGIADDMAPVDEPFVRVSRRSAILVKNTVLPKAGAGVEKGKFLVLGSFANKTNADRFSSELSGFDTVVISASVKGKTYYRVLLNSLSDQSPAQTRRYAAKAIETQAWSVTLCHDGESQISCPAGS
ncbi:MAG: hypothetical protein HOJ02_00915 [Rhodospirillaceae bacterium]|nr:hypothetical protein [Rhodospirillaceae bacterium]